eukprot:COSAG05_NODE_12014_length_487_cov_0.667526_1_plen_56_part_10
MLWQFGRGRYQHLVWKLPHSGGAAKPAHTPGITTNLVPGAFTDGQIADEHYAQIVV